ncbi:hypothetical protein ElyMa_001501700 [Elysia marginata]|uniref:ABC transmembrane type-1 domain-containing protein n=1 Tax=Elysia marginata TaxID=1093978 RepID=A0AAV4J5U2_9GAST|nr:hypothetical protein ElyMa_001501700 [Elysia marginata]
MYVLVLENVVNSSIHATLTSHWTHCRIVVVVVVVVVSVVSVVVVVVVVLVVVVAVVAVVVVVVASCCSGRRSAFRSRRPGFESCFRQVDV